MSFWEVAIVVIIAALILKPDQLVRLARQWVGLFSSVKKVSSDLNDDLQKQIQLEENEAKAKNADKQRTENREQKTKEKN